MASNTPDKPAPPPDPSPGPASEGPSLADAALGWAREPENRPALLASAACLALFVLLFQGSLLHFYKAWTTDDNYSHGFLVPLLSLYFAAQAYRRDGAPAPAKGSSGIWVGGGLLVLALLAHLATVPLPIEFLGDVALLAALAGGFAIVAGASALRRYWFAFAFLIFMVPLPIALYTRIASPLQLMASRAASTVMNATGVPVLCEGNRMTLPGGVQMFVAEACSGMRQLTGFLALATAVAYLARRPIWYRATVIVSALPIALFANTTRVVVTGYIMHYLDPRYAEGTYHTLEGILLMAFGLLMLNSVCTLMDLICEEGGPPAGGATKDDAPAAPSRPILAGAGGEPWPGRMVGPFTLRAAAPTEDLS